MSFSHYAYTFNSAYFHRDLKAKIVSQNELDFGKLQQLAITAVSEANDGVQKLLYTLGYDKEWLADPESDDSQAWLWYTIILANQLHPAPSLSNNRFRGSHVVLELILPIAKWEQSEVNEIIVGRNLDGLISEPEFQIFASNLSVFGGVISVRRIPLILAHLRDSFRYFSSDSLESQSAIEEYAVHNNLVDDQWD